MNEREAVERVVGRVYRERLKQDGRLPASREIREIEKKARDAAEGLEKRKRR